ncbi:hypothetical protein AAU59_13990 [Listeria monocytogenes]|nr:hypothetical protein [Listeria monocytogenes]
MENGRTLVVWFKNGHKAFFEQVVNHYNDPDDKFVTFDYFDVKSLVVRKAVFLLSSIAGYALES